MAAPLRIGVAGANRQRGWFRDAHSAAERLTHPLDAIDTASEQGREVEIA